MFSFGKKTTQAKPRIRKSIPALILNKDWHELFGAKKPKHIQKKEKQLEQLMKKYSQVKQELKEYHNLKKQLMDGILADMNNISEQSTEKLDKKMDTNSQMIKDLNQRIEKNEDTLLELPTEIDECNKELAFETAEYFYPILTSNTEEHERVLAEIEVYKAKLRELLERKVDLEELNSTIYHRLHQSLGADVLDQMDEYFIGKQMHTEVYNLKEKESALSTFFEEEKSEGKE